MQLIGQAFWEVYLDGPGREAQGGVGARLPDDVRHAVVTIVSTSVPTPVLGGAFPGVTWGRDTSSGV